MHQHAKDCLDRLDNLENCHACSNSPVPLNKSTTAPKFGKSVALGGKTDIQSKPSYRKTKDISNNTGKASNTEAQNALLELLESNVTSSLQESAIEALRKNRPDKLGQKILKRWRSISPSFRPQLIRLLRKSNDRVSLLDSLDAKGTRFKN